MFCAEKVFFCKQFYMAKIPSRQTAQSVGFDLTSAYEYTIPPHTARSIDTGIKCIFPKESYGRIAGRSGLALNNNLLVMGGINNLNLLHLNTSEIIIVLK